MITIERAHQLRALIERVFARCEDDEALEGIELYPLWKANTQYEQGFRVRFGGKLYKVNQGHTSQEDWTPDITSALYSEVAPAGTIYAWKRPQGAHDAYNTGDKVYYPNVGDTIYESTMDGNVYSPEEYPAGWKVVG